MGTHEVQYHAPESSSDLLTWKEPMRRRSLEWALRSSFHPSILASTPIHPGLLMTQIFLAGWAVVLLSGGSLPTMPLLLLSLLSALLIGFLPRIFSSAHITIRAGQLIRECGGCTEQWNWAEMRDVHILETYRNGERRELLWFQDSQGRAETVLLPWRQDHTKIKALLAATNKETE